MDGQTGQTSHSVEEWLDSHPEDMNDYFLKRADISLVNRWLSAHGFNTLPDFSNARRNTSLSTLSMPGFNASLYVPCRFVKTTNAACAGFACTFFLVLISRNSNNSRRLLVW
ncbi:phosphodiesterase [Plakobranchus ocellatus]|uniref:Phosphodiesterase n=1 Tax=Plakobranchus ocellatus TaxID=259542 RepID=A0AAV4AW25_9GAST|nr:phosphodiesterase [Plakobranchus ocellatus]